MPVYHLNGLKASFLSFALDNDQNPQLCLKGLAAVILTYLISLTKAVFFYLIYFLHLPSPL